MWDDDDIYLPWHLSAAASALAEADYTIPTVIYSDKRNRLERKANQYLFHGAWAFRREAFDRVCGYPFIQSGQDQGLLKRFKAANLRRADPIQHDARPSYVYRWYTAHSHHISALGKDGYERLGRIAAGRAATITPRWSQDWLALLRVITMTAYRRPAYTREVLDALAKCDGIADWILLPNVEPGHEDVTGAFRDWNACELRLLVNRTRLGLNKNTQDALFRAFQLRADVIVHLEDDTVPSPDALRYFDWAVRDLLIPDVKSSDGHQILLASGYNKQKSEPRPDQSHSCQTRPIWTPWGWAVDRRRLVWMIANWCTRNKKCFTCQFKQHYRRTRREVFPILSRIQNIGFEEGENGRSPEWYRENHRTPWVAAGPGNGSFCISQ